MNLQSPPQHLLRQAAGALGWGAFFVLVPISLIFIGALVWIPVLIWREIVRSRRYGFFAGALARLGVVFAIATVAALLPVKFDDGRVRRLPGTEVTLGELVTARVLLPIRDEQLESVRLTLPSSAPTRREVISAIERQTGYRALLTSCDGTESVLFGGKGGRIFVSNEQVRPYG